MTKNRRLQGPSWAVIFNGIFDIVFFQNLNLKLNISIYLDVGWHKVHELVFVTPTTKEDCIDCKAGDFFYLLAMAH
jgi:hypothetical protein